jgi:hypothetical protein
VYIQQAHRRWGHLQLSKTFRPLAVSSISCIAITATGLALVAMVPSTSSRLAESLAVIAIVSLAALIHGSAIVLGRVWRPARFS